MFATSPAYPAAVQPVQAVPAAQPVPVAVASPVQPLPTAVATPVEPVGVYAPVTTAPVTTGAPVLPSRDVHAFGFVLPDKDHVNPASNLAGLYVSCTCWCFPAPCVVCQRFTAPDDDTLVLSNSCCVLFPSCSKQTYRRNWDASHHPGPPNSFTARGEPTGSMQTPASEESTFEFGACNGLCAGSAPLGVCYLRVC